MKTQMIFLCAFMSLLLLNKKFIKQHKRLQRFIRFICISFNAL